MKEFLFNLLGKEPDAIVVSFGSGPPELVRRMFDEIQQLVPDRRHILISPEEYPDTRAIRRRLRPYRIGLAPVLFTGEPEYSWMRRTAFLLAPHKILAYNRRLERHHLRLSTCIASLLFLKGVPLDRIHLRPGWLVPWKRDRSEYPSGYSDHAGRPFTPGRPRIAVLTPYFPYPLSHGGAVRIYYLLREIASHFDIVLFSFSDQPVTEVDPLLPVCSRVIVVGKPRYREPRWSTWEPPEVREFRSSVMRQALDRLLEELRIDVLQVEYTALASYAGDILVEHDVTFALHAQVHGRERRLSTWWDYFRWRRFERRWTSRYKHVVVMSEEDRRLLGLANTTVIPNGVDLERFHPEHERPGRRLLFIGSFRHFPNIVAYRFLVEQVWPRLSGVRLTVVAGPEPELYWRDYTGIPEIPCQDGIELLGFVRDVKPLYIEANLVLVPTLVSAGTNLKVLEALAMERAVVSTSSGCAGLGLQHGKTVWIADDPVDFAAAAGNLLEDKQLRQSIAAAGRLHAERRFDWKQIGLIERTLLRQMTRQSFALRRAHPGDLDRIVAIQATSPEASEWKRQDYLNFDCRVAEREGEVAGFLVSRAIDKSEREILNIAVDPEYRRLGAATSMLRAELDEWKVEHFLEVRESNAAARALYSRLGFLEVGIRPGYYENPAEPGIVMRFFS